MAGWYFQLVGLPRYCLFGPGPVEDDDIMRIHDDNEDDDSNNVNDDDDENDDAMQACVIEIFFEEKNLFVRPLHNLFNHHLKSNPES